MTNLPHMANRVLNTPLLMEPGYAKTFFSALAPRLGIGELCDFDGQVLNAEKLRLRAAGWESERPRNRPYQLIDGVAVLPVTGSLVHKFGYMEPSSGMTGYDGIVARVKAAIADEEVRGILLDMDSPGGEVTGCFDCADQIYQLRGTKPIWSLCYDMNCSAAMALASATDRRLITQTGIAGSVGVIMAHASYEKQLSEKGVKVTLIHSGSLKADGNPYKDLPEEVLSRFQEQTDALRQQFASKVAQFIGISVDAVLATEAAVYRGQAAIDIGFADELINGNQAIARFIEHLNHQTKERTGVTMTQATTTPQGETTKGELAESAVDNTAKLAEAASAERARIQAILGHAEAEGRSKLASHLAFSTSMSAEEAAGMLMSAAKEQPVTAAVNPLDAAMGATTQPNLSADQDGGDQEDTPDLAAQAVAAYKIATGAK